MKFFPKEKTALNGRVFCSGLYSAAITVAVLVLAVLVNLLVRALPAKYTTFDLSEAGLYTLSDSSAQVAQGLTQDVTIYYLCETGNEDQIISKLLDKYASESSHITWEIKDPAIYPTFAAQYGAQDAASGSLILVSGEQSVVLDASDLYDYDYSDYYTTGSYRVTFSGESKITSAIYRLTSGEQKHAYYTTNHGEQALTDTLTDALENQNLSLTALDLLSSGSVPEDCDLLIINVPAQDFASAGALVDEMSLLRSYLSAGGKVLLTTDTYYNTPNLDAVMAEFGLTRAEGLVVDGDSGHFMNGYPYYLLPDYTSPTETTALEGVDTSRHVLLQMAQGITLTETENVTAESAAHHLRCGLQQGGRVRDDHGRERGRRHGWPLHAGSLRPQYSHRSRGHLDQLRQHGQRERVSGRARQLHFPAGLCVLAGGAGRQCADRLQGAGSCPHQRFQCTGGGAGSGVHPDPSGSAAGGRCRRGHPAAQKVRPA